MSIVDTLIVDRTEAEVSRAAYLSGLWSGDGFAGTDAELAEWLSDLKGSYNASDLNRVGEAMNYLAGRFRTYGYVTDVAAKTDWTMADIPAGGDLEKYLADLSALRGMFDLLQSTPPVPEAMQGLTAGKANDIEQILVDVERILDRVVAAFRRSSAYMFFAGNEPLPSAASDIGRNWEELDAMNTTWANWQEAAWYLLLYGNLNAEGVVESCP